MTLERPAYKIDTSHPGKLASCSFFPTSTSQLSSGQSTACAKFPRHTKFWHLRVEQSSQTLWFQALHFQRLYSKTMHLLTWCGTLKTCYFFTALNIASCNVKGPIWRARQPPPSLQLPSCSGTSNPLIPKNCSHTPSSFSTSPTIIAANTVTGSRSPTGKCSILSTQICKMCSALTYVKI